MTKFPEDLSKGIVLKVLGRLGFDVVREREHISMLRIEKDGTRTPLTLPNHPRIKGPTLRRILTQSHIAREEFMKALEEI